MMRLLLKTISGVPFSALYLVASFFYYLNRFVIRYRYDVVRENLRNSFPERTGEEIDALTEETFRNLADLLVETIKGIGMSREELERRMSIDGTDRVRELVDAGTPMIFLAAHQGNWEWLLPYSCLHLPHPLFVAYQPFHDEEFDEFMLAARTRFGGTAIPANNLIREVAQKRKELKTLALLADQSPSRNERKYWTTFLNQDTAFLDGTDSIAWLTKMPVIFVSMKRTRRGHYEVYLKDIAEPPYEKFSQDIVERYARELEAMIRAQPSAWLWSHRRWKFAREDDADARVADDRGGGPS